MSLKSIYFGRSNAMDELMKNTNIIYMYTVCLEWTQTIQIIQYKHCTIEYYVCIVYLFDDK